MGLFDGDDSPNAYEDELSTILDDPDADPQARKMARQIRTGDKKITEAGLDPNDTLPRTSFFGDLLDTLDAPRQGVAGIIDTALRGDMFTGDVGLGFQRGQEENTTTSDILRRHHLIENPILRGVAGFAGDVLTDPLTYLSLGTSAEAKAAGRTLTEAGQALRQKGTTALATAGVDAFEADKGLNDVFRSVAKYKDDQKAFDAATSEVARAGLADSMAKHADNFSALFTPEEISSAKIFEKPGLHIGANLPFLGHLQSQSGAAVEEFIKDPGIVGQAFRGLGKVFKPGKLKIADIEFSDDAINAIDNVRHYANESLAKVGQQLGKLENVPVIGDGVKAIEYAGKKAADAYTATSTAMKAVFNRKALLGPDAHDYNVELLGARAGHEQKAIERTIDTLGVENLKDKGLMTAGYNHIDGLAQQAVKGLEEDERYQAIIKRQASGRELLDGDKAYLDQITADREGGFQELMDNFLKDPNIDPREKELVGCVRTSMGEIAQQEAEAGLNYGQLSYYITHKYLHRKAGGAGFEAAGISHPAFTKARQFASSGEAFAAKGYVADTDLPSLLQYRIHKGLDAIADRNFAHRLFLTEGLPEATVKAMAQEALTQPNGEAAKALRRWKVDIKPGKYDPELLRTGRLNELAQQATAASGRGDYEAAQVIRNSAVELSQKTHEQLWAAGVKPLDNRLPDAFLGELGQKVNIPGVGEAFFPKAIADALKETSASKDLLKAKLKDSPLATAILNGLDHISSWFRKAVTLPWAGYWTQNLFGDRFNQLAGGLHAINPGTFARTHSILAGESAVTNKFGVRLDKSTLERVLSDMGLNYTTKDHIGALESFSDLNVDKFMKMRDNTLTENLASKNVGAAYGQLSGKFQKAFDGFQRVNHFVARFEAGDTIPDAVKAANDLYFNYRDMSAIEQSYFRRFYMFYGYMSKATKQSVTSLFTRPGNLTMQLHGSNAMAEFLSDPNALPTAEQHDLKLLSSLPSSEQLSHVIGRTPEGKPIFARGFAAPLNSVMQQFSAQTPRNFSVGELINSASDSLVRTVQKQFATANPAINLAAQQISGKNLYFDKPLDAEFLRKLPDLTAAAEKLSGFSHTNLPTDINDTVKSFLGAVPDGKGRLIADAGKMWVLTNLIPGMSRLISTAGTFANQDIGTKPALARFLTGVNVSDQDVSRSYLASRRDEQQQYMKSHSVDKKAEYHKMIGMEE